MQIVPDDLFIDVPVRPEMVDSLLFQRVSRYVGFAPRQDPETGEMVIMLTVQVRHYHTNPDGTAGQYAPNLVKPYELSFRADNTEAVDVTTGEIVLTQGMETPEQWNDLIEADPRPLMKRGNAYKAAMHAGPVAMVPQIQAAMLAADAAPYYRFGGRPAEEPEA